MINQDECFFCKGKTNKNALNCCHCGKEITTSDDIHTYAMLSVLPGSLTVIAGIIALTIPVSLFLGYWLYFLITAIIVSFLVWVSYPDYKKLRNGSSTDLYKRYLKKTKDARNFAETFILTPIILLLIIISVIMFLLIIVILIFSISNPSSEDFKFKYKSNINYNNIEKVDFVVASLYCNPNSNEAKAYIGILGNFFTIREKSISKNCQEALNTPEILKEKLNNLFVEEK